jgi:hypothetical protein
MLEFREMKILRTELMYTEIHQLIKVIHQLIEVKYVYCNRIYFQFVTHKAIGVILEKLNSNKWNLNLFMKKFNSTAV